jgi:hypothetical protein
MSAVTIIIGVLGLVGLATDVPELVNDRPFQPDTSALNCDLNSEWQTSDLTKIFLFLQIILRSHSHVARCFSAGHRCSLSST